jgi:hypothetical protein
MEVLMEVEWTFEVLVVLVQGRKRAVGLPQELATGARYANMPRRHPTASLPWFGKPGN